MSFCQANNHSIDGNLKIPSGPPANLPSKLKKTQQQQKTLYLNSNLKSVSPEDKSKTSTQKETAPPFSS